MDRGDRKVLVCNCEKTMQIDGKKLARALGEKEPLHVHSHLCRAEAPNYLDALKGDESLLVCCTQEAPLFRELASEKGKADQVRFTNIRERAGWSQEGATAVAKMAALVAEAALEVRPADGGGTDVVLRVPIGRSGTKKVAAPTMRDRD